MAGAGEEDQGRPNRKEAAARKIAERQRLAEALRANLSRRKAQSRDRRAGETADKQAVQEERTRKRRRRATQVTRLS